MSKMQVEWHRIKENPPPDELLLLACADWRVPNRRVPVKVGGFWDGTWHVFGASWVPTHWADLPSAEGLR